MTDSKYSSKSQPKHQQKNSENNRFQYFIKYPHKKDQTIYDYINEEESSKVESGSEAQSSSNNVKKDKVEKYSEQTLKKIKSSEELIKDFQDNQKVLSSLSTDISSLFKKITSLTEEVTNNLPSSKTPSGNRFPSEKKKDFWSEKKIKERKIQKLPEKKEHRPSFENRMMYKPSHKNQHRQLGAISMSHFQTGQTSGYGKYGEVLTCKNLKTGGIFALKKIFKSTIEKYQMQQQLLTELTACKKLNHPNIVRSYFAFTDQFHIFLVMEYVPGKKLTQLFRSEERKVRKIIKKVAESVNYMHQEGIVHRDLKPENIMIWDEENASAQGKVKICDFGWSHLLQKGEFMDIICGTLDYVCPEMVKKQKYTKQVDLWSIGVLTFELLFGYAPFKGDTREQTFKRVETIDLSFPWDIPSTSESKDFIRKLLRPEVKRMKMQDLLQHDFIKSQNQQIVIQDDIVNAFQKYHQRCLSQKNN